MAAVFGLVSAACLLKYALFQYNGIDLAYFNQVFWNTTHGRPFVQSIHPHLSLGDHAELAILLLAPLYALLPDPRTLLVLQAAALALAAIPLHLFVKVRLENLGRAELPGTYRTFGPLFAAFLWLASPLIHNVALFEFHVLAFAPLPLMTALLMYERGRKTPFCLALIAALLVREDVALVVAAFGVLAWMERKSLWWRLVPMALGAGWFLAAMGLIAHFAPAARYKFTAYYAWLGDSPLAMAKNAVLHPLRLASHLLRTGNIDMMLGLLIPFAFLPLGAPRRLVLAAGPFMQIALGGSGGGSLVPQTHYAALFLPGLFAAVTDALPRVHAALRRMRRLRWSANEAAYAGPVLLAIAAAYAAFAVGPFPGIVAMAADPTLRARARIAKTVIAAVPEDAAVAASYGLLPHFSSRERLASLHYAFLGVTQFGEGPYALPPDIRYIALDLEDLISYRSIFMGAAWSAPRYDGGFARLKAVAGAPMAHAGPYVLFDREGTSMPPAAPIDPTTAGGDTAALVAIDTDLGRDLVVRSRWRLLEGADRFTLRLLATSDDGRTALDLLLPVRAISPAADAGTDGTVSLTTVVPADAVPAGSYRMVLRLERAEYVVALAGSRATELRPASRPEVVAIADLGEFSVGSGSFAR